MQGVSTMALVCQDRTLTPFGNYENNTPQTEFVMLEYLGGNWYIVTLMLWVDYRSLGQLNPQETC